jgi:hypothetical protein
MPLPQQTVALAVSRAVPALHAALIV